MICTPLPLWDTTAPSIGSASLASIALASSPASWTTMSVASSQSLLPATVGVFARRFGLEAVSPVLFVGALALSASHEALTALTAAPLRESRVTV